jgi:hypothetical protein
MTTAFPSPVSSSLTDLADQYLGRTGGVDLSGVGVSCQKISQAVGSEVFSTSLIATIFWQAFTNSPAFVPALALAGASPRAVTQGERFVLRHGEDWWPRHDLIVFDPDFQQGQSSTLQSVIASPADLVTSWNNFAQNHREALMASGFPGIEINQSGGGAAVEALAAQPFGLIIASPPVVELTASYPSPAWEVACQLDDSPICTVGVMAVDGRGREGVTTAQHAIPAGISQVFVNGLRGTIDPGDRNPVTDSCFIEVPGIMSTHTAGLQGPRYPLRGVTPRNAETVSFERPGFAKLTTTVSGWSPEIPWAIEPWNQLKVLTDPVTVRGDSGTALIDSSNQVIGFAFYTTGQGRGFSAWIWAESVFKAHNLQE